ncbi:hypothetical protein Tco_0589010 [Tanacetum coccineum]
MAQNFNLTIQQLQALDNGVRTIKQMAADQNLTRENLLAALQALRYYEWNGIRIHGTPGRMINLNMRGPYP